MWMSILAFIGGPVIKGLIDAYNLKLKTQTADKVVAKDLAADQIAAETASGEFAMKLKIAQIGHPFEIEKLFAYIVLFHFGKCVVWDTMLGFGSTPAMKGDMSVFEGLIISYYFGKRAVENVTTIIKALK